MIKAIENIQTNCFVGYLIVVVFFAFLMRVLLSYLRAKAAKFETKEEKSHHPVFYRQDRGWFYRSCIIFRGNTIIEPFPDLWYNFILGLIELLIFPILLRAEGYTIIGAWIGFKTVAQWPAWQKNRLAFNRYLIANALQVIISFFLMKWFISD